MPSLNLPWLNLRPFPLVLSLLHGRGDRPHLTTTSLHVVVEGHNVSLEPPLLQSQFPQPLLIRLALQTSHSFDALPQTHCRATLRPCRPDFIKLLHPSGNMPLLEQVLGLWEHRKAFISVTGRTFCPRAQKHHLNSAPSLHHVVGLPVPSACLLFVSPRGSSSSWPGTVPCPCPTSPLSVCD